MRRRFLAALVLWAAAAWAHDPITTKLTWSKEVSRLFAKRCTGCHQPGGPAPFSLATYEAARPWAVAIRDEVAGRTMPPWGAAKGFGDFLEDGALTQEEVSLIIDWVNGGAPEGDPRLAPQQLPRIYAPPESAGRLIPVAGALTLSSPQTFVGLRTRGLPEGAEAKVVLRHPDGSIQPLVWIRNWKPRFAHDFVFRTPVQALAGAQVRILGAPPGARVEMVARRAPAPALPARSERP